MTEVTVWIPPALREFTGGAEAVTVQAHDVFSALEAVGQEHGGFLGRILTPEGTLRPLVNVFVGEEDIRHLQGLRTALSEGDAVAVIPAVAGG